MPKPKTTPTDIYKRGLFGLVKINIFFGFIGLVIFAAVLGFGIDFGSCFGQASCSNGAGMYILLFPILVVAAGIYGYHRWKQYSQERYKDNVRQEVLGELDVPVPANLGTPERILTVLDQYGPQSSQDLAKLLKLGQEELLADMRPLIQQGLVIQQVRDNTAYFTRSR